MEKVIRFYREIDGLALARNNGGFQFKGAEDKMYLCKIRYLINRTYAYIITDGKSILASSKDKKNGYTDRLVMIKDIQSKMDSFGFKSEPELKLEINPDVFFDRIEEKEMDKLDKITLDRETQVKILCGLPASGKTTYYIDNYKRPFIEFIDSLKSKKSYISYRSEMYYPSYDFINIYKESNKEEKYEIESERLARNLPLYLYINLDKVFAECTVPELKDSLDSLRKYLVGFIQDKGKDKIKLIGDIIGFLNKDRKNGNPKGYDIIIDGLFIKEQEYLAISEVFKAQLLTNIEFIYWNEDKESCTFNNKGRIVGDDAKMSIENLDYEIINSKIKKELLAVNPTTKFKAMEVARKEINPLVIEHTYTDYLEYNGVLKRLKNGIILPEWNSKFYSYTWHGEGESWGMDGHNRSHDSAEDPDSFSLLKHLLQLVDPVMEESVIKEIIDSVKEERDYESNDPYSNYTHHYWIADLEAVKNKLISYGYNLSSIDINQELLEKCYLKPYWL